MRYNYNGLRVSQDVGLDSRAGVTEEKREIYLEQMKEILNALGYSMEDTVRTSYLGLLMKKKMQEA